MNKINLNKTHLYFDLRSPNNLLSMLFIIFNTPNTLWAVLDKASVIRRKRGPESGPIHCPNLSGCHLFIQA